MRNDDPEYTAQLERALETAELEIKWLEEQIRKQDETIADIADQLAPIRMGEPMIYSADQLAAARAKGREEGLLMALDEIRKLNHGFPIKAIADGLQCAAAIERLLKETK